MYAMPCPICRQLVQYSDEQLGQPAKCEKCAYMLFTFPSEPPEVLELPDEDEPADDRYEFACPNCGSQLYLGEFTFGTHVICRECEQRVRVPEPKSATNSMASMAKGTYGSGSPNYQTACAVLGSFLLAELVIHAAWYIQLYLKALEWNRQSSYFKLETPPLWLMIGIYIIWCAMAVTTMFGFRWLVWMILLSSIPMLVWNAAFTIGGVMELNLATFYRLMLFGGTTVLSLWCVHELQLFKRQQRLRQV